MLDNLKLEADTSLPLRDVVFQTLRNAILRGDLEPGERLMEIRLAGKLGVSRTPIREAIRMLELEGLVVMVPRRGAQVASMSEENLRDVMEVRESLEELAVELACIRMTEEDLEKLRAAEEDFRAALEEGNSIRIADSDEHYHEVIYRATGNHRLLQILYNLRLHMYRYRLEYIRDQRSRELLCREHEQILDGLSRRDPEEALKAVRAHIGNQKSAMLDRIREQQELRENRQTGKKKRA